MRAMIKFAKCGRTPRGTDICTNSSYCLPSYMVNARSRVASTLCSLVHT